MNKVEILSRAYNLSNDIRDLRRLIHGYSEMPESFEAMREGYYGMRNIFGIIEDSRKAFVEFLGETEDVQAWYFTKYEYIFEGFYPEARAAIKAVLGIDLEEVQ